MMVTIDQSKGEVAGGEVLQTLQTFRKEGKSVMFGMSAFNLNGQSIKKGDFVKKLSKV